MNSRKVPILILTLIFIGLRVHISYAADPDLAERKKQLNQIEQDFNRHTGEIRITAEFNLNDYIRMGLMRNAGLKAAFYKWKADYSNIAQTFSLPDPQFSYTEYIDAVETRVGPQDRAYAIKQKFPMWDKLWVKKKKAFKASEMAFYKFEQKRQELIYKIADVYYESAYLYKAILITQENMKLLKNFESVVQSKYSSGLAENQDLLKVQVELGRLENELISLEDLRSVLSVQFNALLNIPQFTHLPRPNESLENLEMYAEQEQLEELMRILKARNPQLRALTEKVQMEKESLKLAQREYIPDVTVGIKKISTGDALNASTIDSGKDPLMVSMSINVPIWFKRIHAEVDQASAAVTAAEEKQVEEENELYSKLALIHYKLKDANRQSRLYNNALIPKAVQTLNATQSGYESGNMDFLSLIDAQRMLLNFQMAYYRQNANYYQRLAELKVLIGQIEGFQK